MKMHHEYYFLLINIKNTIFSIKSQKKLCNESKTCAKVNVNIFVSPERMFSTEIKKSNNLNVVKKKLNLRTAVTYYCG